MRCVSWSMRSTPPDSASPDSCRSTPSTRERLIDLLVGDVFKEGVTDIFEDLKAFCDLPNDSDG